MQSGSLVTWSINHLLPILSYLDFPLIAFRIIAVNTERVANNNVEAIAYSVRHIDT